MTSVFRFQGMNLVFWGVTLSVIYLFIVQDLSKSIKKITTFLGINVSDSEINQIAWKASFREMKINAAKENCDPNKTICALTSNKNLVFRKGKSGSNVVLWLGRMLGSSSILPCLSSFHHCAPRILHNTLHIILPQWMFIKWNSWIASFPDFEISMPS